MTTPTVLARATVSVFVLLVLFLGAACTIESTDQGSFSTCAAVFSPTETSGDEYLLDASTTRVAMPFILSASTAPSQVSLRLQAAGSPTGNLTLEIQADASSQPSNIVIETATLAASSVSATASGYYAFVFGDPVTLSAGTYWMILRGLSISGTTDSIKWMGNDQSLYSGGSPKISSDGNTWTTGGIQSGRFFLFKVGC